MPSSDPHCAALGIPVYLHQNGREPDPEFSGDEKLFVRFALDHFDIKTAVTFRRQSCNREKYCDGGAVDVLLNTARGGMHQGYGVMSITVAQVRALSEQNAARTFALRPEHRPDPCNYAHAEIVAHEDGWPVDDIKPKSVKKQLRDKLSDCFRIELPPARISDRLPRG